MLFPFQEQISTVPRDHVGLTSNKYSLCKFFGDHGPCLKVLKVNNSMLLNSGNLVVYICVLHVILNEWPLWT